MPKKALSQLPQPVVTRFAPSPTGLLHLGHVAHAMAVWDAARAANAQVLFRMEDHDQKRCRPHFDAAIVDDLTWLGFSWDGPIVRQSERQAIYLAHARALEDAGLAYGCNCSRRQILERTPYTGQAELRYDNHCRDLGLPLAKAAGWRVRLPDEPVNFDDLRLGPQQQSPKDQCGDLLIRDRDGHWTYQFCVVVDDWLQGVTLVVRGADLLSSTGRQIALGALLGRADVPHFLHHPLIVDATTGDKLSKRDGALGIRELRRSGLTPEAVLAQARALLPAENAEA